MQFFSRDVFSWGVCGYPYQKIVKDPGPIIDTETERHPVTLI